MLDTNIQLPNCKEIFLPSTPTRMFFNADYSGADAMVVAADSECKWLLDFFANDTRKLYVVIASEYLQTEISTNDPRYKQFKAFIHGTNYGMQVAKAAATANMSLRDAAMLQKFYFSLCPEIPKWHKRIIAEIYRRAYIENCFGARFWFKDLTAPTWTNQAFASIPQSTIAVLCNKGLIAVERIEDVYTLLQVHDAAAGEFEARLLNAPELIKSAMEIPLPYEGLDLTIPVDIEISHISYGNCMDIDKYHEKYGTDYSKILREYHQTGSIH